MVKTHMSSSKDTWAPHIDEESPIEFVTMLIKYMAIPLNQIHNDSIGLLDNHLEDKLEKKLHIGNK